MPDKKLNLQMHIKNAIEFYAWLFDLEKTIYKCKFPSGLPDFLNNQAKPSLVLSQKQRKQKVNTMKNKEHC